MKKSVILILVFLVVITLTTCKKTSLRGDYFIFGVSFGECSGNCVTYFLLKNDKLYPDRMTETEKFLEFKNKSLDSDKAQLAKQLKANLPSLLQNSSGTTFGCPDCRDQGAFYLEIGENSKSKKFHIDTDLSKLPNEIQSFVAQMESVLDQLETK